jgi:hypothetical protein
MLIIILGGKGCEKEMENSQTYRCHAGFLITLQLFKALDERGTDGEEVSDKCRVEKGRWAELIDNGTVGFIGYIGFIEP